MSPEEWKKLSAALDELLDLPEAGRDRFLQKLRAENPEVCKEIESLLQQRPTERLEAPPSQLREAPTPTERGAAAPLPAPDPAASKLPEVAGYEMLGLLGRGGMGVVYKARQRALDRVVALKMIRPGAEADEQDLLRFRTEAEASARLQHPNIVQIYEVGEQDGRPYLALEYVGGGGLDRFLGGAPQPPRAAAEFVAQLARAMHYAHGRGVLHRDLKPSNVLLSGEGPEMGGERDTLAASAARPSTLAAPKITDFGLAKRLHSDSGLTQTGAVLGTPSYMAPEQAAGDKNVGAAADVYALGAILYEMLTGRPPFRGPTAYDTLLQVRQSEPAPPSRLQPRVPRDLETICLKCLQKSPAKRYAGAGALADDLGRYLAGRPILARPAGRAERAWRWCRRNPKDAALVAAGLLAVVLGVVAYLWISGARQAAEQDRRDRQAAAEQDRRDRQAQATTKAERKLTDANSLWAQAKTAAVGELHPWEDALSAARQVKEFIDENAVDEPTRRRVEQTLADVAAAKQEAETKAATAARDKQMKDELDKLAFDLEPEVTEQGEGIVENDPDYEGAFARYGIRLDRLEEAEARIRASAIRPRLVAALDAWIPLLDDEAARRRVADLANRVSEPDEDRRELREALVREDLDRLRRLAMRDLSAAPLDALHDLAWAYSNARAYDEAVALLRPAQQLHPGDFAINFYLAYCLGKLKPPRLDEQTRFYTAAVAIQPKNSTAHNSLGNALSQQGRLDEAVAEYRTANQIDPKNANALANLRNLLPQLGRVCLYTRRPAAAARLFKEAFATMAPGRADAYRFEAAQAAAQAGVGKLPDAASLMEEQRADWRTQAREWLRADLSALAKKAESDKAEDRQAAARQLRLWQGHVAFAGLRDEAELMKLPQDEQTAWRQFWADVAALADRAEKR